MMKKLVLTFGGQSVSGVKPENQDAFTATLPDNHSARKFKGGLACIADGVSNSQNAQLASQTAVTNFALDYFCTPEYWSVQQSAHKVISAINSWLYQQSTQNQVREDAFVTTFSALIIKSHTAHIFHAGDSRIYRLRDNALEQLTRDHAFYRGKTSSLTRALGFDTRLELDYKSNTVMENDVFILTTDGVHEHLSEAKLKELLRDSSEPEQAAKQIVSHALELGSQDNASCLLVRVDALPIERLIETVTDVTNLVIPPELKEGNKLDHFEIKRVLHSSTRSHVYLARNLKDDRRVVLKVPSTNFNDDQSYHENFAREQWIGRKLKHSNIVSISEPVRDTQFMYHVCDYIEGQTLRQWMIDNPEPSLEQVREIVNQIIKPVRFLQRNKMIHRDLKPENFMINRDGQIVLIDLGTIKISGLDEINFAETDDLPGGDLHYIAPEILVRNSCSWRSDLFSIATIVYEMLSGELPYDSIRSNRTVPNHYSSWKYRPLNTLSNREDLPKWLDSVLRQALDPRPENRFSSLSEFEQELARPSKVTLELEHKRPLLERDPLFAWKCLACLLALSNLLTLYFLAKS